MALGCRRCSTSARRVAVQPVSRMHRGHHVAAQTSRFLFAHAWRYIARFPNRLRAFCDCAQASAAARAAGHRRHAVALLPSLLTKNRDRPRRRSDGWRHRCGTHRLRHGHPDECFRAHHRPLKGLPRPRCLAVRCSTRIGPIGISRTSAQGSGHVRLGTPTANCWTPPPPRSMVLGDFHHHRLVAGEFTVALLPHPANDRWRQLLRLSSCTVDLVRRGCVRMPITLEHLHTRSVDAA